MKRGKAYIISAAAISAQEPFKGVNSFEALPMEGGRVLCKDPDFKQFIPPMEARRMSSILKRTLAVSKYVMENSPLKCPDAIISGTGNGCVGDTEVFLKKMIDDGENMLNPSKFICSTPNTCASQIAIALGCNGFNSTHVNDAFSMEGALLDSIMQFEKGEASSILMVVADQMTDNLYRMLSFLPKLSSIPLSEGATAFLLENKPSERAYAVIEDMIQIRGGVSDTLDNFLSSSGLTWDDIDLVMTSDFPNPQRENFAFIPKEKERLTYKQWCGEYLSASAFGLFCCSDILKNSAGKKRILLAVRSGANYSFTLISNLCTN